jgi:hypothetical protein
MMYAQTGHEAGTYAKNWRWLLMAGAFFFSAAVSYAAIRTYGRDRIIAATALTLLPNSLPNPAAGYQPAPGRSSEMQAFDKAILYLSASQHEDGHWSAAESGADPEFATIDGDISLTALATAALLDACAYKDSSPETHTAAGRGLKWLQAHQTDGQTTRAQIFTAMAFLPAARLSTSGGVEDNAVKLCRRAIASMCSSSSLRADLTALGTFTYISARFSDIAYSDTKEARSIELSIRSSLPPLNVALDDWNEMLAGLLTRSILRIKGFDSEAGLNAVLGVQYEPGKFDENAGFPGLESHVQWGANGEGYEALSMYLGTILFCNYHPEDPALWCSWMRRALSVMTAHQSSDGSWEVAGRDAKFGRIWRTALHARAIALFEPPITQTLPPGADPNSPQ